MSTVENQSATNDARSLELSKAHDDQKTQTGAKGQPPADENAQHALRAKVESAKEGLFNSVHELAKANDNMFVLRILIAFHYLVIRVGDAESSANEILEKLRGLYPNLKGLNHSTIQHYSGPLLGWLQQMARRMHPGDSKISDEFGIVFLRRNPAYLTDRNEDEVRSLAHATKTLIELDRKYGNGRIKPPRTDASPPPQKRRSAPVQKPRRSERQLKDQPTQAVQGTTTSSDPAGKPVNVTPIPSNEELLQKLADLFNHLCAMKRARVSLSPMAKRQLNNCQMKMNELNGYSSPSGLKEAA